MRLPTIAIAALLATAGFAHAQTGVAIRTRNAGGAPTDRIRIETSVANANVQFSNAFLQVDTIGAPALSPAGSGRIFFDGTQFLVSQNGGAYTPLIGAGGGITSLELQAGPSIDMAAAGAGLSVAGAGNVVTYTLTDLWVNATGDTMTGVLTLPAAGLTIGVQPAHLSDGSAPNAGSNLIHWDNLTGVPAGFADGSDDGAGAGAPVGALYVALALDGTLTAERVLTAGGGIGIVDGGANGPITVSTNLALNDGVINEVTDLLHWNELQGVPAGFADGVDDTGAGSAAWSTFTTPLGTSPVADVAADALTWIAGGGISITGADNPETITLATNLAANDGLINEAGDLLHWNELQGVPAGFADGTDADTTYTAGAGLTLGGTVFSTNLAANDGIPNEAGDLVNWNEITNMPAGFADGSDDGAGGGITSVEGQAGPAVDMAAAGAGLSVAGAGNVITYTLTDLWVNTAGDAMTGTLALTGVPALTINAQDVAVTDATPPNAGSNLIHWDNLTGVPAGFADGTDDGAGGGAPAGAQYVTLALDPTLTAERVLTQGNGISLVDGGANGPITVSSNLAANDGIPNEAGDLVNWNEITNMPGGFADGNDAAGVSTINTIAPDGLGDFDFLAGANIALTPGVNSLTVAVAPQGPGSGLNADLLDGLSSANIVQFAPAAAQIDSSANALIFLNKTVSGVGNMMTFQKDSITKFTLSNAGNTMTFADTGGGTDKIIRAQLNRLNLEADTSVLVMLDNDNNSTTSIFTVRANNLVADLFTVSETGEGIFANTVTLGSLAADPVGVNGMTYYNTGTGKLRGFESGAWQDLVNGAGGGAPTGAQYVTLALDPTLSAERVLTQGNGISIVDGGANGPITVSSNLAANDGIPNEAGDLVNWNEITNMPLGFVDGTDADTTYTAGAGLTLGGTTFTTNLAAGPGVNTPGNLVSWNQLIDVPAGFADNVDNTGAGGGVLTINTIAPDGLGDFDILSGSNIAVTPGVNGVTIAVSPQGAGSGLSADLLDGLDSSAFMAAGTDNWVNITGDTMTGALNITAFGTGLTVANNVEVSGNSGFGIAAGAERLEVRSPAAQRALSVTHDIFASTVVFGVGYDTNDKFTVNSAGQIAVAINHSGADHIQVRGTQTLRLIDNQMLMGTQAEGTAAAPAYSWHSDADTGVFHPAADTVAISTGGVQRISINPNGTLTIPLLGAEPAGSNGQIYYNTATNKLRGFENGAWQDLVNAGGGGGTGITANFDAGLGSWTVINSSATVVWAADANGTPVGGIGNAWVSAPNSLNYNDGVDFDDAGLTNNGTATSPDVTLSATSTSLTFQCNYQTEDTGITYDQRWVEVSNDNFATFLIQDQLSETGFPAGGACTAMGNWHAHNYVINPAWGTIKVRFRFNTIDGAINAFSGWYTDNVVIPP